MAVPSAAQKTTKPAHIVLVIDPIQISRADPVGYYRDFEPPWRM